MKTRYEHLLDDLKVKIAKEYEIMEAAKIRRETLSLVFYDLETILDKEKEDFEKAHSDVVNETSITSNHLADVLTRLDAVEKEKQLKRKSDYEYSIIGNEANTNYSKPIWEILSKIGESAPKEVGNDPWDNSLSKRNINDHIKWTFDDKSNSEANTVVFCESSVESFVSPKGTFKRILPHKNNNMFDTSERDDTNYPIYNDTTYQDAVQHQTDVTDTDEEMLEVKISNSDAESLRVAVVAAVATETAIDKQLETKAMWERIDRERLDINSDNDTWII